MTTGIPQQAQREKQMARALMAANERHLAEGSSDA
jgi:hypothetical protein